MKTWTNIGGDISWDEYGGRWAKADKNHLGRYYILDFVNMWDACGQSDCERDGQDRYICEVRLVDLSEVSEASLKSAYDCCGLDMDDPDYQSDLCKVEALHCYGCSAPMDSFSANTYAGRVRAQARRCAEGLMTDAAAAECALGRPVNAIGSTAREYGLGDLDSAMARHRERCEEVVERATEMATIASFDPLTYAVRLNVNMKRVPSDDPIAYSHGFMTGYTGGDRPADDDDLAEAWLEGYAKGLDVKDGKEDVRNLNAWVKVVENSLN